MIIKIEFQYILISLICLILAMYCCNTANATMFTPKMPSYQDLYEYENEDYSNLSNSYQSHIQPMPKLIEDPFEVPNRLIFSFNMFIDTMVAQPIVYSYRAVIPEKGRKHVSAFVRHITTPISILNNVLQGELKAANVNFWRFIINSVMGFAGITDVASELGLQYDREDFDQTLGSWNVPTGPYLVLPVVGPSTARGTIGKIVDFYMDPLDWQFGRKWRKDSKYIIMINSRSEKHDVIQGINKSLDPYTTMKSLYIQNRLNQIHKVND